MINSPKVTFRNMLCSIGLFCYSSFQGFSMPVTDYTLLGTLCSGNITLLNLSGWEDISLINWYFTERRFAIGLVGIALITAIFVWGYYWRKYRICKQNMHTLSTDLDRDDMQQGLLSHTLSLIDGAVLIADLNKQIVAMNPALCSLIDTDNRAIGKPVSDYIRLEKQGQLLDINAMQQQALDSGIVNDLEEGCALVTPAKGQYEVSVKIVPMKDANGNIAGIAFKMSKVDLCNRQEKFFTISMKKFNAYPWFCNFNNGEIIYGNSFPFMGIDVEEVNTFAKYANHVHPEDRERFISFFNSLSQQKEDEFSIIYRVDLQGNGIYRWAESRGMIERVEVNGVEELHLYGIDINIDGLKQHEIELSRALEKAKQSDKLKGFFLANVSHEVRTPLNSIVGFSDLLTQTYDAEERKEFVSIIKTNSNQLLQVISDILSYSKIESGDIEFSYSEFDLTATLATVLANYMPLIDPAIITLSGEFPYRRCFMHSDKKQIEQVVNRLLNNAVKFTPAGSVKLGYSVTQTEVLIYVRDSGIGIKKEDQERIFTSFTKLDEFLSGVGLGLAISQTIVKRLNGILRVESEVGEGSTFTITLPCKASMSELEEHPKDKQGKVKSSKRDFATA